MNQRDVPSAVAGVGGEVISSWYYSHRRLNTLYWDAGAPSEPPEGNCVDKCTQWLKLANSAPNVDALEALGGVLEHFMEVDTGFGKEEELEEGRTRIRKVLSRYSLSYHQGGIIGSSAGLATRSLEEIIREGDLSALDVEFERALQTVESDLPASLTAAFSLLESLFKTILEDDELELSNKQTVKPLWREVQKHLGLSPADQTDADLQRVLTGLASLVDGLGALRTHSGSAHGRGRLRYKVEPRHARWAVHGAHTLAVFLLETWVKSRS